MDNRITLEETDKYLREWHESHDEESIEKLIKGNEGLVKYIAKKYLNKGLTFEELLSAGNEGLIRAINMFNYEDNNIKSFSSYVGKSVENSIILELRKYNRYINEISLNQPISKDKDGNDLALEDLIGTDADELIENAIFEMKNELVRESLNCLTSREKQIILLRYGLDDSHRKTQEEIAKMFNCNQTTIVKQEQKALIKMRHPRNTKKIKDFID